MKLRCGNLEQDNKYWLEKIQQMCIFYEKDRDCLEHYVKDCEKTSGWVYGFRRRQRQGHRTIT